jgi:hypothetical protein
MKTFPTCFAKGFYLGWRGLPGLKRRAACSLLALLLFGIGAVSSFAQIQQAWVAKYDNGIPDGNHQALKMVLDASGNIYVLGVSANANTNTGYVVVKYARVGTKSGRPGRTRRIIRQPVRRDLLWTAAITLL